MKRFDNVNSLATGNTVNNDTYLLLLCEAIHSVTADTENKEELLQSA